MVIEPKVRGFICVTTHPVGCAANVQHQIDYVKSQPKIDNGPKKVLVIGASTGYGLASRISAAFGAGAATLGVFFEKPGTEKRPGSAGWYNSAAFTKAAQEAGLYARNVNGDAFSDECREKVSTAIDTNKDTIIEATVEPATPEEVQNTVTVMGGQDWELWMQALEKAGVLAEGCKSVAYSYIGTEITWPIYWHGALGKAKEDLDRASKEIRSSLQPLHGDARVVVLKSVVTQASAAIPVMPLYIALCFRVMREQGIHESVIEHIFRMFNSALYGICAPELDADGRVRMDSWELRDSVQLKCKDLWPTVTTENLKQITDYEEYKHEFLQLFGFEVEGVDYSADVNPVVDFDCVQL